MAHRFRTKRASTRHFVCQICPCSLHSYWFTSSPYRAPRFLLPRLPNSNVLSCSINIRENTFSRPCCSWDRFNYRLNGFLQTVSMNARSSTITARTVLTDLLSANVCVLPSCPWAISGVDRSIRGFYQRTVLSLFPGTHCHSLGLVGYILVRGTGTMRMEEGVDRIEDEKQGWGYTNGCAFCRWRFYTYPYQNPFIFWCYLYRNEMFMCFSFVLSPTHPEVEGESKRSDCVGHLHKVIRRSVRSPDRRTCNVLSSAFLPACSHHRHQGDEVLTDTLCILLIMPPCAYGGRTFKCDWDSSSRREDGECEEHSMVWRELEWRGT